MSTQPADTPIEPIWVWGLPLAPLTFQQTLDEVKRRIDVGQPGFIITANLHYAMLTARDARLPAVNDQAHFIGVDGMPLVWATRWRNRRLPERVAGSDLVPAICGEAAKHGWRVFLLGGAPGIGELAAARMKERHPESQFVGIEAPDFRTMTPDEEQQLIDRIRAANPQVMFVALGQPVGEIWLAKHRAALGVPVCVQIGASLDFLAGKVQRAPQWIQRIGMEWFYRLSREPKRLIGRYTGNAWFAFKMLLKDMITSRDNRK